MLTFIEQVCNELDCQIGDVVEFIKDEDMAGAYLIELYNQRTLTTAYFFVINWL